MNEQGRFYGAPFAVDGGLLGVHECNVSELSPKWLAFANQLMERNGATFRVSLGGPLAHLEIKLTASQGMGLGMIFANGQIVVSTAYFVGADVEAEVELETMFVESLRNTELVKRHASTNAPFDQLFAIRERPLHVVVVWGTPSVTEQDHELIREVANHFAGAFLFSPAHRENRAV